MKFRFCGDLDCPDWLLAEISTLSKLTSIKMKQLCGEVLKDLLTGDLNYEQVEKWTSARYEESDIKAAVAALAFIMSSAAKFNVDSDSLGNELQQLGLPKENVGSLCKVYSESLVQLQDSLKGRSLRVYKLDSVDWRVDYILSSSSLQDINEPSVQLKLTSTAGDSLAFSVDGDQFRVLLKDLKQARQLMENL
ncbi:PREDICTED: COMM domain-containing protein 4-like [Amphimedon queenslandica]|uniref:COMM domain-containing protein n=1 Tax=Amphimedon queenslandica TaxID=400682 RepID=A0A1X7UA23_AMPQE|nr:PREDICTED: COMM domain-containing protein 4-like [Amphimedon queenslandica]|eukprot:XP_011405698.1 PREDICTED: COMM domain-containing protein 4-like [Amphimedon queenslandica]